MYRGTAWAKKASTLPSDRIPQANKQPAGGSAPKSKGKQKEVPKSKEVRRLEELRDGLRDLSATARDPSGGCFCLARVHALSTYTPTCRQCGLILCSLNRPPFACPHCTAPLLNAAARESLISSLETQIADTLAKEERDHQQAMDDARKAAGAFPSLLGAGPAGAPGPLETHPVNQTHKVLSLNSKTHKIKVEKHRAVPQISRSASASDVENQAAEKVPPKVPHPPPDVVVSSKPPPTHRPWARLDNADVLYVPPPKPSGGGGSGQQRSARNGKGKKTKEAEAEDGHGSSSQGAGKKPV